MKKHAWQALLGILVGGGLFYWAFKGFSWDRIAEIRIHWGYLLNASIAMLTAHFLRAWRWTLYVQVANFGSSRPAVKFFFHALMAGYAVNQVLPRAGELVRCTLLYKVSQLSLVMLLGTVLAERIIDVLSLGAILLTLLVGDWERVVSLLDLSHRVNYPIIALVGVLSVLGILVVIFFYRRANLPVGIRKLIQNFTEGFLSAWRVRRPLLHLGLTLGIWGMYGVSTFMALRAVLPEITLWQGWYLLGGSSIAISLPSPGGIGTFHAIGKIILERFGYPTHKALSAILVVHGFQYFLALFIGAGSALYLFTLKHAKSYHPKP